MKTVKDALAAFALLGTGLAAEAAAEDPAVRHVAVRGTRLAFTASGAGEPIVAVHGALSDRRVWRRYAPLLSQTKRFIAYSQRYFGTEGWPDAAKDFTREAHVADLIGLVEALEAGPVHLVTWSYGGEVATYAMLRRPELFRSAVHFEPSLGALLAEVEGGAQAQARFAATLEPAVEALSAGRSEAAAFLFIDAVFGLPAGTMAREPEPAPTLVRDNARTLGPFLRMAPGAPLSCADLAALDTPVLILRGEHTQARYRLAAEAMAACLPRARLKTMVGAGHDGPYWAPEDFAAMIQAFHAGLH